MKLRKLLAALLAVCMLLTMLPVAAFAAGRTVIDISSVDGEIVVECDGVEVVYDEANKNWKGSNWELGYVQGILWLDYGEFEVNNDLGVMGVWIFPDATLAGGSLGGAMVMNDGGKITGGHFENEVYNAVKEDTANNKQYVGVISGGVFNADVDNDGGKITGGTFNSDVDITGEWSADETIWFVGEIAGGIFNGTVDNDSALISGGTFNGEVENYGEITGGTFNNDVYNNWGEISDGTFNSYVENISKISGGTFNSFVGNLSDGEYYGEITGGTFISEELIYDPYENVEYDNLTFIFGDGSEDYYPAEANGDYCYIEVKWDDDNNKKNIRPEKADWGLTVINRNNMLEGSAWVESLNNIEETLDENTWVWLAVANSPKALLPDSDAEFAFTFTTPEGYTASVEGNTITMKLKEEPKPVVEEEIEEETYDIVVRVKFDGVDESEIDFVNAQLLKNGKAYKKAVKIDDKDEWTHEWENLDDSSKIEWSVTADEIEGYNMEIVNVRANYWTITLSAKDAAVEKANPETGASDFVGAAVALAACSAVCGAALMLKRK